MEEKRISSAAPVIAVMALLIVLLATYVAGYFLRPEVTTIVEDRILLRMYPTRFEERIFEPAATIESALTNQTVFLFHDWTED